MNSCTGNIASKKSNYKIYEHCYWNCITHSGSQTNHLEQCTPPVTEGYSCSRHTESQDRFSIMAKPRCMQTGSFTPVIQFSQASVDPFLLNREHPVSPFLFSTQSDSHTVGGCTGARVVNFLCFSPSGSHSSNSGPSEGPTFVSDANRSTLTSLCSTVCKQCLLSVVHNHGIVCPHQDRNWKSSELPEIIYVGWPQLRTFSFRDWHPSPPKRHLWWSPFWLNWSPQ